MAFILQRGTGIIKFSMGIFEFFIPCFYIGIVIVEKMKIMDQRCKKVQEEQMMTNSIQSCEPKEEKGTKNDVLVFLSTFDKKDASMEVKTDFIIGQAEAYSEFYQLGEVFDYRNLPYNDPKGLKNFISEKIKENKPKWIVGEGTSATVLIGMKIPGRIMVNPKVTFNDLNNVPNHVRESTFGFFDKYHEKDYERFQSVYPNSAWYPQTSIDLCDLKSMIENIILEER